MVGNGLSAVPSVCQKTIGFGCTQGPLVQRGLSFCAMGHKMTGGLYHKKFAFPEKNQTNMKLFQAIPPSRLSARHLPLHKGGFGAKLISDFSLFVVNVKK